jgi:hypothetical protein
MLQYNKLSIAKIYQSIDNQQSNIKKKGGLASRSVISSNDDENSAYVYGNTKYKVIIDFTDHLDQLNGQ